MTEKTDVKKDMAKLKGALVNFLIPLICIGASAGLFFVVIYPSINSMPNLKNDLTQKKALDTQLQSKLANLKKLVDFKKSLDETADVVSSVLVSETMVPELMTQIDIIAKESGLTVSSLSNSINTAVSSASTAGGGPKKTSDTVVVSMSASATYDQLITFFEALENSGRIVNVDNFRYSLVGENAASIDVNMSLSSPYLFVQSNAVTDDPVDLDITSKDFLGLITKLKSLRIYKPSLEEIKKVLVTEVKETTPSAQ